MLPEYLKDALAGVLPNYTITEHNPGIARSTGEVAVEIMHGRLHPWRFGEKYTAYNGTTHALIGREAPLSVFDIATYGVEVLHPPEGELIYMPDPFEFKIATHSDVMTLADSFNSYEIIQASNDVKFAQLNEMLGIHSVNVPIAAWDKNTCTLRVVPFHREMMDVMHEDVRWTHEEQGDDIIAARTKLVKYAADYFESFKQTICEFMVTKRDSGELDDAFNKRVDNFVKHFINPAYKTYEDALKNAEDQVTYRLKQIRDLKAQLVTYGDTKEKYESKLASTTKEIDLTPQLDVIRNIAKVESVDINENEINVVYKNVEMRVKGVRYSLPNRISTKFLYDGHMYTKNLIEGDNIAPHPHIQNTAGEMCAGNAGEVFPDLFSEGRYDDIVDYMLVFLETADPNDTWGKNYPLYHFIDISGQDRGLLWSCEIAKIWNTFIELALVPANYEGDIKVCKIHGPNVGSFCIPVPVDTDEDAVVSTATKFMKHIGYNKYSRMNLYIDCTYDKYVKFSYDDIISDAEQLTYSHVADRNVECAVTTGSNPGYVTYAIGCSIDAEYIKEVRDDDEVA